MKEHFDTVIYSNQTGFTNLLALKIALTLLSAETYKRKLAYLFTLLSTTTDGGGTAFLLESSFDLYLRHILTIAQYFEDISVFFYDEDLHSSIFNFSSASPISSTTFIEVLTNYENQADFTAWLIVYHRLADAELVTHHQATCAVCGVHSFSGFRYKCKKCNGYNLCQDCFWTGKSSGSHDADQHPCKEYLFEKPRLRQSIRQSFRNSFRRSPKKSASGDQQAPPPPVDEQLTRKELNLTNIIASPTGQRKFGVLGLPPSSGAAGLEHYRFYDIAHLDHQQLPGSNSANSITTLGADEEHTLIGHYLHLLSTAPAASANTVKKPSVDSVQTSRTQQGHFASNLPTAAIVSTNADLQSYEKAIEALESKNRHLMAQIAQMKMGGGGVGRSARLNSITSCNEQPISTTTTRNDNERAPGGFFDELLALRRKKDDLDVYLGELNDHRKVLMVQLDGLMSQFQELDVNGNSGETAASEPSYSRQSSVATTVERQFSTVSTATMDTVDGHLR